MTHFLPSRFVAGAMTTAAALAMFAASTRADAISFFAQGSQQVPSLDVGGVTITGSSFLDFDPLHGLAIGGGLPGIGIGGPDNTIDPTESITFRFDGGSATGIALSWLYTGTFGNPSAIASGESLVTAFGPGETPLGTVDLLPGSTAFNISAAFANQPISSFTLEPSGNAAEGSDVTLSGLTFNTVPEPASLLAWSAAAVFLARRARKSRKTTTARQTRGAL
jgi:hypothetical protein